MNKIRTFRADVPHDLGKETGEGEKERIVAIRPAVLRQDVLAIGAHVGGSLDEHAGKSGEVIAASCHC